MGLDNEIQETIKDAMHNYLSTVPNGRPNPLTVWERFAKYVQDIKEYFDTRGNKEITDTMLFFNINYLFLI